MTYTLNCLVGSKPYTESDDDVNALRNRACRLFADGVSEISMAVSKMEIVDDDGNVVFNHKDLIDYCLSPPIGGGGGGGSGGGVRRATSTRRLEYTVAFFRDGGAFAVVLVNDSTINSQTESDRLCAFLQKEFQQPVLLITNSGKTRSANPHLLRNFRVPPSLITGWQKVTITIRA